MTAAIKRCAIYTRKSTEDGLKLEFNSLDAQREACEAFIQSQKSEGWRALAARYDDGGASGGDLKRKGVQQLFADIAAGHVDIVVVYKVDRLTRSLADFAKIVERFDAHDVSFVAVTQQFNTSTSMGRLTLNVLLSFAQFEREVTAERIRDKIAASRRKGLWTGGNVPLGFDAFDKKLRVNAKEAPIVKSIFDQFVAGESVPEIMRSLAQQGVRNKSRANGRGGKPIGRSTVYKMLGNPLYAGLIRARDELCEGQHEAIIPRDVWDAAQARLDRDKTRGRRSGARTSPLAGKLFVDGRPMTPSHTTKGSKRYRYYVAADGSRTNSDRRAIRVSAPRIERAVADLIREALSGDSGSFDQDAAQPMHRTSAKLIESPDLILLTQCVGAIKRVNIVDGLVRLHLDGTDKALDRHSTPQALFTIECAFPIERSRGKVINRCDDRTRHSTDENLQLRLVMARQWRRAIIKDGALLKDLAAWENIDPSDAAKILKLAFLAPDVALAIARGHKPKTVSMETIKDLQNLPVSFAAQRKLFGLAA